MSASCNLLPSPPAGEGSGVRGRASGGMTFLNRQISRGASTPKFQALSLRREIFPLPTGEGERFRSAIERPARVAVFSGQGAGVGPVHHGGTQSGRREDNSHSSVSVHR